MKEICGLTLEEAKYVIKQDEYFLADEVVQSAGRVLIEEIEKLKSKEQKLIEKLEADKKTNNEFEFMPLQIEQAYNNYYKLGKIDEIDEILKILKGENDE